MKKATPVEEEKAGPVTQTELDQMMADLASQLKTLGIPLSPQVNPQVQINTRAKRRLGCCIRREGRFTIQVSVRLLENRELLRTTLIHELLHTCYGCQNHGKRWKSYAARAGEALGCPIQRTVQIEGEGEDRLREDPVKYLLVCETCGRQFPRRRMSQVVKNPRRYRCPCGGILKRIL